MNVKILKYVLSACLFGTLIVGCSQSKIDDGSVISVSTTEFAPVDSFFTSYEFVALETSDSTLLDRSSIFHTSDKYIVAYSRECGFNTFDRNGKSIAHFSNKGQGPGEASFITDFYIDGEKIVCVPFMQPRLLVYNIQNGNLIEDIELPNTYYFASNLNQDLIALSPQYSNNSNWNIDVYNTATKSIVGQYLPYEHLSSLIMDGFNVFVGHGAECVFGVLPFDYSLYSITGDKCEIVRKYEFDTPEKMEPINPETVNISELSDKYRFSRVVKWLGKYCETKSGTHYQHFNLFCDYGVLPFLCKYYSNSSQSVTLRIGAEIFSQFPYLTGGPFEIRDGYYICATPAISLLNMEKSQNADTFSKLGLQEDSNPVIFFYKLKE